MQQRARPPQAAPPEFQPVDAAPRVGDRFVLAGLGLAHPAAGGRCALYFRDTRTSWVYVTSLNTFIDPATVSTLELSGRLHWEVLGIAGALHDARPPAPWCYPQAPAAATSSRQAPGRPSRPAP